MKLLITSVLVFMAIAAAANEISYKADTQLPIELQQKIQSELAEKCIKLDSVKEVTTKVDTVRVDQGIVDYFYLTNISASWYYDVAPPLEISITVKSAQYEISNPVDARFQVLEILDDAGLCQ